MLVSRFTFYRGAALPMAADLATTPTSGLRVQLCGDAHLSNFDAFASPERRLPIEQLVPTGMAIYAGLCGWTLARAHARSGDRIALAAYLGKSDTFDLAVADFAKLTPTKTRTTTPRSPPP